ncbi:TetR/AcrR family transcriptional regulator [Candidatus Binatia bacterium]|nr:TetR/AcrR family transcriptional regulator [Candidatus Binatia bacterium]
MPASRRTSRKPATSRRSAPAPAEKDGRERILAVAIRSFSEQGYEGTTTAGIAREVGVTQPLVHHHFGSKEALWRAAVDELFADVGPLTTGVGDTPEEQLLDGAERFVRFVSARPEVTRVIAREGAAPSPRLTYLVDRYLRPAFGTVVEALRAGQRSGAFSAEFRPELVLMLMLGAGSHPFDVTALMRESLGIDATSVRTRDEVIDLLRAMLSRGLFRNRKGR